MTKYVQVRQLNSGKFNTNARKIGNISGAFLKVVVGIHMENYVQ
jgi:hypothetical protein